MTITNLSPLPDLLLEPIVRMALGEDLLPSGDITSDCVIEHDTRVELHLRAREAGVFAGCDAAQLAGRHHDNRATPRRGRWFRHGSLLPRYPAARDQPRHGSAT
ncbi:MAG: hypothetical protein EBV65_11555 [Gammaproteobacteria bacterium]|nr:hypothetical protein [Gammaproteobacteria bacterium]